MNNLALVVKQAKQSFGQPSRSRNAAFPAIDTAATLI